MQQYLGQDVPKLGFGLMRLPTLPDGAVDLKQVERMTDAFMQAGFTYFDTAYGYHDGKSEEIVRRAVVERYAREKYLLATKLPLWLVAQAGDPQRLFATQLERTGVAYFDYYMLHAYNASYAEKLDALDVWGFLRGLKADGRARHIGLSFHDSAQVLDALLSEHPEVEFVQLQINYADWDDENVQSRLCYETARRHGKAVIVMEPVKGGSLAAMGPEVRAVMEQAKPGASPASWAMRYAASLQGVITVLSGMSDLAQMQDNIATLRDFTPLSPADRDVIARVQQALAQIPTIPCTDCKYCVENGGCPQDIPIPGILRLDNVRLRFDRVDRGQYAMVTKAHGKASDCIQCGACEGRCPQRLEIISLLRACAETFEA